MKTLKPAFTKANKYLFDPSAYSWSLPSGTSCPFALKCLAAANRSTGKIISGPRQEFKCYSAQYERYPSVRARVWANLDAVRGLNPNEVCDLLDSVKPTKAKLIRVHSGGDFSPKTTLTAGSSSYQRMRTAGSGLSRKAYPTG